MGGKWRLLVLLGYAGLMVWEWASISAPYGGIDPFSFEAGIVAFALAPVAFLCLISHYRDAMGIVALLVVGLGIWLYDLNDGDPIGLLIIIFYQYCATGLGCWAIVFSAQSSRKSDEA